MIINFEKDICYLQLQVDVELDGILVEDVDSDLVASVDEGVGVDGNGVGIGVGVQRVWMNFACIDVRVLWYKVFLEYRQSEV